MNTKAPVIILMLLLQFLACDALRARDYFVSPSGSDTTGDGSMSNPWKSIAFALESVYPGDVLYLRGGVYSEQLISVRDGTPSARITISTWNGEEAYIDGNGVTSGNNGCLLSHSYMTFRGFTVRNWLHDGMTFSNCSFIELKNIKVTRVTGGISLKNTVHDFVLDSCVMYDYYGGAGGLGFDATPEEATDRIYNGAIRNCKAYLTAGAFDNCDGFALGHDGVSDITFTNCETYGVGDGFDISGTRILLERCSAHSSSYGGGYKLWRDSVTLVNCIGYDNSSNVELDYDYPLSRGVHARLINCTFYACRNANIWIENSAGGSTLELYNCILAGGDNIGLSFDGDSIRCYTGDFNLFHMNAPERAVATSTYDFSLEQLRNGEWTAFSGQDAHSKIAADAAALFADTSAAKPDLRPRAGSPAVDGGSPVPGAPATDYDNAPRGDGRIDIGAYEYSTATGIAERRAGDIPAGFALDQNYPNPFARSTTISVPPGGDRMPGSPRGGDVSLKLFDLMGRELLDLSGEARLHSRVTIRGSQLPAAGIYLYRFAAGNQVQVKRMVFVK